MAIAIAMTIAKNVQRFSGWRAKTVNDFRLCDAASALLLDACRDLSTMKFTRIPMVLCFLCQNAHLRCAGRLVCNIFMPWRGIAAVFTTSMVFATQSERRVTPNERTRT
jgi:hypothetical protein